MLRLTKSLRFEAAHRLFRDDWPEDQNSEVFGRCARMHGHDYVVEIAVCGRPDPEDGMVLNVAELKRLAGVAFLDEVDHTLLNEWGALEGRLPTVENLCLAIWRRMSMALRGHAMISKRKIELESVRLWESPNNSATTWTGEDVP